MSIARIQRIRDLGVFRDFTWPQNLADFGRYNLIYGWNGSGKTTLARLFRALETRTPPPNGEVTIAINDKDVTNNEFAHTTLAVRVFNRDFVEESVFPTAGGNVVPIFVFGKQSVEKQKRVEQLKTALVDASTKLDRTRTQKADAENALDRLCIDVAKNIKYELHMGGASVYSNYNKSDFQSRAQQMTMANDHSSHQLNDEDRNDLLMHLRATPKQNIQSVAYQLPQLKDLSDTVSKDLSVTVVSVAIQSLKDDSKLAAWVRNGLRLHQEHGGATCLFCDQSMPKDRLTALESHFNTEYEEFLKGLDNRIVGLEVTIKNANDLAIPSAAEVYDDLSPEFSSAAAALRNQCDSAKAVLRTLLTALEGKKSRPFERLDIDITIPELDVKAVERLNQVIQKHNLACDQFQIRVNAAREKLEAGRVADQLAEFVTRKDAARNADGAVATSAANVERLKGEIAQIEREIIEHLEPAEELNQELRSYLGHDEIRFEAVDNGYTITRHGVHAEALSEGEKTAIALLYFLKSLTDRQFDLKKGVIVLDDPVSSLDANALYSAFGFIQERSKNAAQLFIFTHNFGFFRQIRGWFHQFEGQGKKDVSKRPARFYMLDCFAGQDQRQASIRWLDPLLEQFNSEYHYLFATIYRATTASHHLGQNYVLPNLARRLLEAFLAFRQPEISGALNQKLKLLQFDEAKKIRILRFLHTHSHGDALGEPEHDLSLLSEGPTILQEMMELMKSQDLRHFDAMVKLVCQPAGREGDE